MLWKSQLQSEIALSTTHAEYVALSQCMRVMIPMTSMVKEILTVLDSKLVATTTFHSEVFEDNMGAYYLANNQKLTARSKHFLTKYHFFWQAVREGIDGVELKVSKVDTKLQNADYLTKRLPQEVFHANRQRVQGWIVMLDNKPQFVPEFVCNSPEIVRDAATYWTALSPTYERESKGIPGSIHGATTQSGFPNPTDISQSSQEYSKTGEPANQQVKSK